MKREFIIAEIRRVARELGRAPGKREFLKRTGISEIDWSGRYWLRWSEALSEAGSEPIQPTIPPASNITGGTFGSKKSGFLELSF